MIVGSFEVLLIVISTLSIGPLVAAATTRCAPCACTNVHSKLLNRWLKRADCRNKSLLQFPDHLPANLEDIDASSNRIDAKSLRNVALYENLLSLSLQNCDLKSISDKTFKNLTSLIHLDVTGNRFQELDDTVFSELQSLRFLFGLETDNVDKNLFRNLDQLRDVDIILHQLNPPGNLFHGLQLKKLSLNLTSSSAIPDTIFDITNHSLQEVVLFGAELSQLPNKLFYGLVMLHKLRIHAPNLKTIPESIFKGYNKIITNGDVESKNLIEPGDWLNSAPMNLAHIELSGMESVQSGLFQHQLSLESLKLTGVGMIPFDMFTGLQTINTLDLSGCILGKVPKLRDLSGLKVLNMSGTHLQFLQPDILTGLHSLQTLDISYNQISSIPAQVFTQVGITLTHLNLSHNALVEFQPDAFVNVLAVRDLDLSNNRIVQLDGRLFFSLHNLQILNLANNSIFLLPDMIFREQEDLVSLNLSRNCLKELPENLLVNAMALRYFDVSGNQLVFLPSNLMQAFDQISMTDNPVHCDCNLWLILRRNRKSKLDGKCATPQTLHGISLLKLNMSTECVIETTEIPTTGSPTTETMTARRPTTTMFTSRDVKLESDKITPDLHGENAGNNHPRNSGVSETLLEELIVVRNADVSSESYIAESSTLYVTNSYWFIAGMGFLSLLLCATFITALFKWMRILTRSRVYEVNK